MSEELQTSYDRVAGDYAENFRAEMDHKPFDRKMLDWLAEKVGERGAICDMGCGPGQVARYLAGRGAKTCGVDLSAEMVAQAKKANPEIAFEQGDMTALSRIADDSFGGIAAFYSIIHIPKEMLDQVLTELKRVLVPGGSLLVTFHIGHEVVHMDEWWGKPVSLDFNFLETQEIKEKLQTVGFETEETIERDPYAEIEYQSRRAYIFARKPSAGAAR